MKRWFLLGAVLLTACEKPEPTFPAPGEAKDEAIAAECRLIENVLPRLIAASPQGNVVLSPHTLASALAAMQSGKPSASGEWVDLEDAKPDTLQATPFRLESVIGPSAKQKPGRAKAKPSGSAFIRNELEQARKSLEPATWVALFDAQVAGVPTVSRSLFRPAQVEFSEHLSVPGTSMTFGAHYGVSAHFRSAFWSATSREGVIPAPLDEDVVVTFSQPINEADAPPVRLPVLPCSGGGLPAGSYRVALDLRVPTFCARTRVALADVAPDLRATLPADLLISARLGFDARGTINLPPHVARSPGVLKESDWRQAHHELYLDRPFFVTVHERGSGHILYVAYVREANDVNGCGESAATARSP